MAVRPTGELRFVTRNNAPVLQQRWALPFTYVAPSSGELELDYEYEWRDVPTLDDDPGPFA